MRTRTHLLGFSLIGALAGTFAVAASTYAASEKLVVASFGGQLDEVYKAAFEPFAREHDVTIDWVPGTAPGNVAKLAATRNAPEYDLVLFDDINQRVASAQGLLSPIDPALVKNWANLTPRAQHHDGVAIGAFVTGLYYRADVFAKHGWAAPTSWNDLYRTELCNHLGLERASQVYTVNAVLMLADAQPTKIDQGISRFAELAKCARVLEPAAAKHEEKILLGEYLAGVNSSIRALPLTQRVAGLKFVLPEEGAVVSTTMVSAVKGSQQPQLAQAFIDWFLTPGVQDALMRKLYYTPVNLQVAIPEDLHRLGIADQATLDQQPKIDERAIVEHRRDWTRKLERALSR